MEATKHFTEGASSGPQAPCVVLLSRDPRAGELVRASDAGEARHQVRILRAPTPYEAAAMMLSCQCVALVVELSMVSPKHMRLLEIARQTHVEVLGVGSLPQWANAEMLSGVRLTAWSQLPAAIAAARALAPTRPQPEKAAPIARPLADDADNQVPGPDTHAHEEPFELEGVYESDIAPAQPDFDLEGSDIGGTYQQELDPGAGRQSQEQPQDPQPDQQPQSQPQSGPQSGPQSELGAAFPQTPPLGVIAGALAKAAQSQPSRPPRPQSPDTIEGSQLLDATANADYDAAHVSAEDIGRWISGLDEDHAVASVPHGEDHPAPPTAPTQRPAGVSEGAPRVPGVREVTLPPPSPTKIEQPARAAAPTNFKPHELNGLLTSEELDALLGRDK